MKKKQYQQEKQKILAKTEISVVAEKFYVATGSQENQHKQCRNRKYYVVTKIKLKLNPETKIVATSHNFVTTLYERLIEKYCDKEVSVET